MKASLIFTLLALCITPVTSSAQDPVPAEKLLEDFVIVQQAYTELHPALYKYQKPEEISRQFAKLKDRLDRDQTRGEAYLAFAQFLATIQCGHTYANFWNQPKSIKEEIFRQPDKLPVTHTFIEGRMFVVRDLSEQEIPRGTEIIRINDIPVATILDSLLTVTQGDGANDQSRLVECNLTGLGDHESFDVYFPLFFPPVDGSYRLDVLGFDGPRDLTVQAITRAERRSRIEKKYGPQPAAYDDSWEYRVLPDGTAYLRMGTWVTYKMEMNWKKFISDAFEEIAANGVEDLVIDIRGNGGGMTDVGELLVSYIVDTPLEIESPETRVRFERVADNIDPYLKTWDNSFKEKTGRVQKTEHGFYLLSAASTPTIKPKRMHRFSGNVYLLTDGSNSSATYIFADLFKRYRLGTIVGEETGGNQMGTNGGEILFLHLPNSRIEMDIPLIGYYPAGERRDGGILPDVPVAQDIASFLAERDLCLEAVEQLVSKRR